MKPDKYSEAAERSNNNLNRRQEELLRRSLSSLNDSVPAPPPGLPVSLMRAVRQEAAPGVIRATIALIRAQWPGGLRERLDRKSTRLNSSHVATSYAGLG